MRKNRLDLTGTGRVCPPADNKGRGIYLCRVQRGYYTLLDDGWQNNYSTPAALKVKVSSTSIEAWVDGTLEIDTTDSTFAAGAVASQPGEERPPGATAARKSELTLHTRYPTKAGNKVVHQAMR